MKIEAGYRTISVAAFTGLLFTLLQFDFSRTEPFPRIASVEAQTHQHASPAEPASSAKSPSKQTKASSPAKQEQKPQEEQETPTVEIPLEKQQLIGVKTTAVASRSLRKIIRAVGRIDHDERHFASITTKFEGYIEKLFIDYTGKYVKKGDPVAELYSPELYATQQEFLNLLKWSKVNRGDAIGAMLARDADVVLDAARQRLRLWDISDEQIAQIESTGKPVRRLTIYSPVSGFVTQKMVLEGMRVMPGEKLVDVTDLATVWLIADIYEYEIPLVKPGQQADIILSYFPGRVFTSRVDYVYPTLTADTRTARVRFSIPNPDGLLKPGMYTNVELNVSLGRKLAVPEDALIDTGTRQVVYVDKGNGYFEPREVLTGTQADGMVEIVRGLKSGEKIASSANFLIDSEAKLKGVKPLPRQESRTGREAANSPRHQH